MKISEIKARLEGLNARTQKKAFDVWKPKNEHDVRLVKKPKDEPFPTLAFHYNIGDAFQILCPKVNFGEDCAICELGERLRAWKDDTGKDKPEAVRKADWDVFKKIQAVEKVFTPVVEREVGEDGKPNGKLSEARWWGLTQNQAKQILEVCLDPDRLAECGIDPGDEEKAPDAVYGTKKAFDLHVSFQKPNEKGNNKSFTQVIIKPKFKATPLTGNVEKDAAIVDSIKPLAEVFPRVPSAEVEKALKKWVGEGMKPAEVKGGTEKYDGTKAKTNSVENASKAGGRSLDDALAEMTDEA